MTSTTKTKMSTKLFALNLIWITCGVWGAIMHSESVVLFAALFGALVMTASLTFMILETFHKAKKGESN